MKIKLVSDLHLEFSPFSIPYSGEELLIIAGDVCPYENKCVAVINDYLTKLPETDSNDPRVILVLGNHDSYHKSIEDTISYYRNLEIPGLMFLENNSVVINKIRFFGATMWTDMDNKSIEVMELVSDLIADYRAINNFSTLDAYNLHIESKKALIDTIEMTEEPIFVITHHLPSFSSIDEKYKASKVNASYASTDLDDLIHHPNVFYWCHGHTHQNLNFTNGYTRILCNPRGYVKEFYNYTKRENKNFDPDLVFEI